MLIPITDPHDPRLSDFVGLREALLRRDNTGRFIAEGLKVIERAFTAGCRPRAFLLQERWLGDLEVLLAGWPEVPVYLASMSLIEQISGFHVHRGALASFDRQPEASWEDITQARVSKDCEDRIGHSRVRSAVPPAERPQSRARSRIAVLEDLSDHSNVGAVFRSAAALGVDAVLLTPRCADPLYRRSIRVSMGTVFQVPWRRLESWPHGLQQLQAVGYVVAGMTLGEAAITLDELASERHQKLALVFGTEGHGLTPEAERWLNRRVKIPMMSGVDSLNVAASSAVAFYMTQ